MAKAKAKGRLKSTAKGTKSKAARPSGKVKPVPAGYHTLTPYLIVRDAARAIDFYKQAFGAQEIARMPGPDGKGIMHAEIKIGDSMVMLADEMAGMQKSPQTLGGTGTQLFLYVKDADAVFDRAVAMGAKPRMNPADMFWGDRFGQVEDPFGHQWDIATHIEDVKPPEMGKRAQAFFATMGKP